MTTPAALLSHRGMHDGSRGVDPASLRARARLRATLRASRLFPARSRTVTVRPGRWLATATDPRADSSSRKSSPDASDGNSDGTPDDARRSPFPIEDFERRSFPTAARFLWASRGLTQGTGLKPLNVASDWLEQDGVDEGDAGDGAGGTWIREMRLRHELIDHEPGCVVWDPSASAAAETLLPMMRDWLCERQPERYVRTPDGGVEIPSLDGWRTGPLESLKGLDALKTCAKLVQEELCLVREETLEDLWMSCEDDEGDDGPEHAITRACDYGEGAEGGAEGGAQGVAAGAETARHTFEAGVVCFSFDPRKRHKKTLAQVHAPVPGYEAKMRNAVSRVFANLRVERPLWRANWVLQNSDEVVSTDLEWHPTNKKIGGVANRAVAAAERAASAGIERPTSTFQDERHTGYMDPLSDLPRDASEAGERMHLRVEYETVRRLPGEDRNVNRWVLFTVRTHLDRIDAFDAQTCAALHAAMAATDDEELRYKSLGDANLRTAVTEFLAKRAGIATKRSEETVENGRKRSEKSVVGGTDTGTDAANSVVPSGKKCPFFKGDVGSGDDAAATEANTATGTEANTADTTKRSEETVENGRKQESEEESRRVAAAIRAGIEPWTSASAGVASSATPPASWYFDPLVVPTLEREKVFAKGWTWAGRLDQVATNGSYLVGATGTVKYVVVRGEDGVLRAFHNACRHHGMEIASAPGDVPGANPDDSGTQGSGFRVSSDPGDGRTGDPYQRNCPKSTAKCFACPYHGWTYDLDGSLVKATKIGGMRDFVVAEHGLKPIRVAEWGPFVMLRLGDPATEEEEEEEEEEEAPIEAWMGPDVAAKISASWSDDPKSMRFVARREYRLRCNWKVFADNYLDGGYHVPFAHPALVTDGVDMRKYETEVYGEYVSVQTVNGGEFARFSAKDSAAKADAAAKADQAIKEQKETPRSRRSEAKRKKAMKRLSPTARRKAENAPRADDRAPSKRAPAAELTRLGDSALYAFVYPNLMINRYGPWMDVNVVLPTGPNECVVLFDYFIRADATGATDAFVNESLRASDAVQSVSLFFLPAVNGSWTDVVFCFYRRTNGCARRFRAGSSRRGTEPGGTRPRWRRRCITFTGGCGEISPRRRDGRGGG